MSGWKGKVPSHVTCRVLSSGSREHAWSHEFILPLPRPCPSAQRLLPWSRLDVFSPRRPRPLAPLLAKEGLGEVSNVAHTTWKPIAAKPVRQTGFPKPPQDPAQRLSFSADLPNLGSLLGRARARAGAPLLRNRPFLTTLTLRILGKLGRSTRNQSLHASSWASKVCRFMIPDASSPHPSSSVGASRIRSAVANLEPIGVLTFTHCPRGPPGPQPTIPPPGSAPA